MARQKLERELAGGCMSVESELTRAMLRFGNIKWTFSSGFAMQHYIRHRRPQKEKAPHHFLSPHFGSTLLSVQGFPVYQVAPKQATNTSKHILFLHGGAYVSPMKGLHWDFIKRLMQANGCSVTVPLYGLAPNYNYRDAYRLVRTVYRSLLQRHRPQDIILMGDSSGGGLALGLAQVLRDEGQSLPGALVLLSPWLDIRLQNPGIRDVEPRDPILAVPGNREAGRLWAAGADPSHPQLSPVNGSFRGLPPTCLLIGTDDILMPDCLLLRDRMHAEGTSLTYHEFETMFHVWMLSPIPEARQALQRIVKFLERLPMVEEPSAMTA